MPLIDMITDIKSFNYNKVGKKQGEYFGEENATGFTPNREHEGGADIGNTEYKIGSGNLYNFNEKGKNFNGNIFFEDTHATGFTPFRTEKDISTDSATFAGEYIIGSSQYETLKSTDFVMGAGRRFTRTRRFELDIQDEVNLDTNYSNFLLQHFDSTQSGLNSLGFDYNQVINARDSQNRQTGLNLKTPTEVLKYETTTPNLPINTFDNPYGTQSTEDGKRIPLLIDRLGEVDKQYKKFGGNAGLRANSPDNPGNANDEMLGFDAPFITKEIGEDGYSVASALDEGIIRGGVALQTVRTIDDGLRLASWTLTSKGILFNAKQLALQLQNPVAGTRLFNPLSTLGSVISPGLAGLTGPIINQVAQAIGKGPISTNFPLKRTLDIPGVNSIYDTRPDGLNIRTSSSPDDEGGKEKVDEKRPGTLFGDIKFFAKKAKDKAEELKRKAEDAIALAQGKPIANRLVSLTATQRINDEGSEVKKGDAGFFESLGMGNQHFNNPDQVVNSSKGPFGTNLDNIFSDQLTPAVGNKLNTKYSQIDKYSGKDKGQSQVPQSEFGNDDYKTTSHINVDFHGAKDVPNASKYNLGKGKVKRGGKLYEVGVSNKLQVPYHGKFNFLNGSLSDKNKIPDDYIKFRIRDAVNGKWLIFPAHLGSITDTVTPEYTKDRYIGRPDQVHIYTGASRNVTFDFKVAAFTKQEIPIIQEKMNYLMGLGYPTYKTQGIPVSPYVYLTLGDLFNNTPGYFENIAVTIDEGATWEIDDGFQIPQVFSVSLTFVYVGKYIPTTTGKHYEVPWLKDSGVGTGKHGTFGTKDPRDGNTNEPDRQSTQKWAKELQTNESSLGF